MKSILTTILAIALSIGGFAQSDTMFIHKKDKHIVEIPTQDVDSIIFFRTAPSTIPVIGVALSATSATLPVGGTTTLTATVAPNNATNKNVTWLSGNDDIATVNSTGRVTAVAVGSTKIFVTTADGSKTAECVITVNPAATAVTGVELNKDTLRLKLGQTETLIATVLPTNAGNKNVSWSSDRTTVAIVDQNGLVAASAVNLGTAKITVTTAEGNKIDECVVIVSTDEVAVESIALSAATLEVEVYQKKDLTAAILPTGATNKNVTWRSADDAIAMVSSNGLISAIIGIAPGVTKVFVTTQDGNKTDSCEVTVVPQPVIAVDSVRLNKHTLSLHEKVTDHSMNYTVWPENATDKHVSWSSNNTAVATVNDGAIHAVAIGTATITITTYDGNKTDSCIVTVTKAPILVDSVTLSNNVLSVQRGNSGYFTATIHPANADNKQVTWKSLDESIATLGEIYNNTLSATVTGVAAGTTHIVVTSEEGGKTDTIYVTVTPIFVSGIGLNKNTLQLTEDSTATLTANVNPSNADNKAVIWASDNEVAATVDQNGLVKGIAAGTAVISATTVDTTSSGSHIKANCTVTVVPFVSVESVSLNESALSLARTETKQLTAMISPTNATVKDIIWTSSDNAVATVSNTGLVTVIANTGTATITATTVEGGKTAQCVIIATAPVEVESISLDKAELKFTGKSMTATLQATPSPANATFKTITWTTADATIATVSNTGLVTGLVGIGQTVADDRITTITATSSNGKTATCQVTVDYLDTVSFRTETTWEVGNQIWSDVVFATGCVKSTYNGGASNNWYTDCRSNTGTFGQYFSVSAVQQYKTKMCPAPWRVPTSTDFVNLDKALGGNGGAQSGSSAGTLVGKYVSQWGLEYGGSINTNNNSPAGTQQSVNSMAGYWSQNVGANNQGIHLMVNKNAGQLNPNYRSNASYGFQVRCVKDK